MFYVMFYINTSGTWLENKSLAGCRYDPLPVQIQPMSGWLSALRAPPTAVIPEPCIM